MNERIARPGGAATVTVVVAAPDGARRLEEMRWGLVPRWAADPRIGAKLINVRAETLGERPAFREALRRRRALIPADGFYEWAAVPGRTAKQALRVRMKTGEPFAFAGLWDEWQPPEGGPPLRTCTVVTVEANALMARFHHRMPAILAREAEDVWLDPRITDPRRLLSLLVPYPAEAMAADPVSPAVGVLGGEHTQLALPLDPPI